VRRFGKSYTVEPIQLGEQYKFRSASVSVDVVVANDVSTAETHLSDHPLNASGEPPNDLVRGVLRTNAPKARWIEIEAAPFGGDYALRSSDNKYIAVLISAIGTVITARNRPDYPVQFTVRAPEPPVPFPGETEEEAAMRYGVDQTSLMRLRASGLRGDKLIREMHDLAALRDQSNGR
jgi:hypothetical protein